MWAASPVYSESHCRTQGWWSALVFQFGICPVDSRSSVELKEKRRIIASLITGVVVLRVCVGRQAW